MKLSTLLGPDQIILEMKAGGHWDSILELVNHLVNGGFLPPSLREECLTAFKKREDQVSTGIGYGVAIPHVFSDHIDHVIAVFGRSRDGIDFEAIDNAPVHYIILFLVPRKDYQLHLRTLAAIAKLFTNSDVRRQMSAATTRDEILAILDARPAPSPSSVS
jgi:mannitol/fructose-specific phosphotransferase system IIA component (Ntr-type)